MKTEIIKCDCDGWRMSFSQIVDAQIFADNHGLTYSGTTFKHCPWCGDELKHYQKSPSDESVALPCKICGEKPDRFKSVLSVKGVFVDGYVIECDLEEDGIKLPFVEHRVTVYGKNEKEAIERWNEVNKSTKQ